jgi:prepilin-type processing-associated H-X9-DG protein
MLILLLACAPTVPDCGDNQHVTAAGECADDPEIPGAEDLPACEPLAVDDRIEVYAGCADGACSGFTYEQMVTALGEEGACHGKANIAFCDWSVGIEANFTDEDGDSVPDETAQALGIFLDDPYDGASENGLGLGVSLACWIDVYGYTDEVEYQDDDWITELWWASIGLFVHDVDGDGVTDTVSLFGM